MAQNSAMDMASASSWVFDEPQRLAALAELQIVDTPPEREFDQLARLAATGLGVASAAVSLIDEHRQWFKARHGIPFSETVRDIAFCNHAIRSRQPLVVPDARQDPRFRANPLVTEKGGIRFYAGVPLLASSGHCLGSLCVFDPSPREGLSEAETTLLEDLAQLAAELIESRHFRRLGEIAAKVVAATSDAVVAADAKGVIVYWNPAAERMYGRTSAEALGKSFTTLVPHASLAQVQEIFGRALTSDQVESGTILELSGLRADGSEFPVELSLARWGEAPDLGVAAIVRDISARCALERDREQAERFLSTVISNLPAMLFVKDADTRRYLMINQAGENFVGRAADDIIGATDGELFSQYAENYTERDSVAVATEGPYVFESEFIRPDGEAVHLRTTRTMMDGPDRPNQYILGISENVTETRLAEAKVRRLAHYDSLTGLLNRSSFTDRLYGLVRNQVPFAMLSIDLDRFKSVNDQFGHPVGDKVLAEAGKRLQAVTRSGDWVARVGGDEFVVIATGKKPRQRAQRLADRIITAIAEPFAIHPAVVHVGASIGIVLAPEDGRNTSQLRENADLALYRAKQQGKGLACFFDAEMDAVVQDRRRLEKDLREAVDANQIELEYQPVFLASSGRITSVEALARWTHPDRGPIRPDVFVSLAEESGLIDQLGEQLLHRACADALEWPEDIRVAVNLSPLQFLSGNLVGTIHEILETSGLSPDRLQLEVTESLVIRNVDRTFEQLEQMRILGIQILMDDFGVGYSSLSYFQRFPFDKVKIDKSFVDTITTSRAARAIVHAVIELGDALGMGVVGEGVETEEQMSALVEAGCSHLQGYFFSRPLTSETLSSLLNSKGGDPDVACAPNVFARPVISRSRGIAPGRSPRGFKGVRR